MPTLKVAVVGGTGFVGREVVKSLVGHDVRLVTAPRLSTAARDATALLAEAETLTHTKAMAADLRGFDVVVNAAGDPDASSLSTATLFGANALLPAVLAIASERASVKRFVHVSSAVVQNDSPVLDSSESMKPFSPYSASKVAGEEALRAHRGALRIIRYRPPSVHDSGRRVTRMVARIAASPVRSVAAPGDQSSPQALLANVGSAIAFLATVDEVPPGVVHHPSEAVTVTSLMRDLGGREPRVLPRRLASSLVRVLKLVGRAHRPTAANARRVELLWLGQSQAPSWLSVHGWVRPVGPQGWRALGAADDQ